MQKKNIFGAAMLAAAHFLASLGAAAQAGDKSAPLTRILATANLPGIQLVYTHGKTVETYALGTVGDGSQKPVTARMVLRRTTGLPNWGDSAGAWSLLTNAHDYALFLQAVATGKGLQPATHQLMLTKAAAANWFNEKPTAATPHVSWELGVGLQDNDQGRAFWHWGDNGDFKAFYIAFPDSHQSLVYFIHDSRGLFITQEVLDLFFGRHPCWAIRWSGEGYEYPWSMEAFRDELEKQGFEKAATVREQVLKTPGDTLSELQESLKTK